MSAVLIVDGSERHRQQLSACLGSRHVTTAVADAAAGLSALDKTRVDVAIVDVTPPSEEGWTFIARARSQQPTLSIIVACDTTDLATARRALSVGAVDFFDRRRIEGSVAEQLELALGRGAELSAIRHRADALGARIAHHRRYLEPLIGTSSAMVEVRNKVRVYADAGPAILIQGPTGAGKEVVAKALHESSRLAQGPFVPVDLPTLVPELLVAELFGHVRGAYTGAPGAMGAFEAADGGTLFLDEIGDLPLEQQAKLLRAIETRETQRVGSQRRIQLELQIVAATNRDLRSMVAAGRFREDLFYRLKQLEIVVPPLASRRDDIPVFVDYFLSAARRRLGRDTPVGVEPDAMAELCRHPWPGNVRELKSFVEGLVLSNDGERVKREAVTARLRSDRDPDPVAAHLPLRARLAAFEKRCLEEAVAAGGGSLRKAARVAGESFSTFHSRLRRHGLMAPRSDRGASNTAAPAARTGAEVPAAADASPGPHGSDG